MMHLFFVLSWFVCSGGDPIVCQRQPDPSVHVFSSRQECVDAAADLMKKNDEDTWRWMNPLHYTCAASHRWVSTLQVDTSGTLCFVTSKGDRCTDGRKSWIAAPTGGGGGGTTP